MTTGFHIKARVFVNVEVQFKMTDRNTLQDVVDHAAELARSEVRAAIKEREIITSVEIGTASLGTIEVDEDGLT